MGVLVFNICISTSIYLISQKRIFFINLCFPMIFTSSISCWFWICHAVSGAMNDEIDDLICLFRLQIYCINFYFSVDEPQYFHSWMILMPVVWTLLCAIAYHFNAHLINGFVGDWPFTNRFVTTLHNLMSLDNCMHWFYINWQNQCSLWSSWH